MFESSTSQQNELRAQSFGTSVHVEERTQFWTLVELAKAMGVVPEDIMYFVNNGSLKAKKSPTTGTLLLPSNAHQVFEQLFFDCFIDEILPMQTTTLAAVVPNELQANVFEPQTIAPILYESKHCGGVIEDEQLTGNRLNLEFVKNMGGGTKSFVTHPCLWLRKGKKSLVFFLRVKGNKDLELLKHQNIDEFTQKQLDFVLSLHSRFQLLRSEKMPWNSLTYLNDGSRKVLQTFNDLLEFYRDLPLTSNSTKTQIKRMSNRYFSGEKGTRKISAYCAEQFATDYLDAPIPDRAKTDRDTIIKLMSAAYTKAESSVDVEKLDFNNLVKNQVRNRNDPSSKVMPKLSAYISILKRGVELGCYEMVLNLIIQETMLTRKARTTHQEVSTLNLDELVHEVASINLDELVHEIPAHLNKNNKLGRLLMPPQIKALLVNYLAYLKNNPKITKDHNGQPKFLFESPLKKGQPRANFDEQFNAARKSVINTIEVSCAENKGSLIKAIRNFTPHRLRDLSDKLFLDVGSTLGLKEKAAGRSTNNVARAYEDLSEDRIIELKTKKFDHIVQQEPDYQWVINTLIDKWKMQ